MGRNTAMYGLDGLASLYGKGTPALIRQLEKAQILIVPQAPAGNLMPREPAFMIHRNLLPQCANSRMQSSFPRQKAGLH